MQHRVVVTVGEGEAADNEDDDTLDTADDDTLELQQEQEDDTDDADDTLELQLQRRLAALSEQEKKTLRELVGRNIAAEEVDSDGEEEEVAEEEKP